MFDTITFDEASKESADNIGEVIAKFESHCLSQRMYERYLFNKREQEPGEKYRKRLSAQCDSMSLRDSLIRGYLILGVKNYCARKKLLEQKDLPLDKDLDFCKSLSKAR